MKKRQYLIIALACGILSIIATEANAQRDIDYAPAREDNRSAKAPRKSNNAFSNQTVISGVSSLTPAERSYLTLQSEQSSLESEISNLTNQLSGAKKGKTKKLNKKITELSSKLTAVERRMAAYPRSITHPAESVSYENEDQEFRRQLDEKISQKVAEQDFDNEPLEDVGDPEIEKAYKIYREGGEEAFLDNLPEAGGVVYRVQVGSGRRNSGSSFRGVSNIKEVGRSDGTATYYSGSFKTYDQAKAACATIRSTTRYRDAFVVAMVGDKKISLSEAKSMR